MLTNSTLTNSTLGHEGLCAPAGLMWVQAHNRWGKAGAAARKLWASAEGIRLLSSLCRSRQIHGPGAQRGLCKRVAANIETSASVGTGGHKLIRLSHKLNASDLPPQPDQSLR